MQCQTLISTLEDILIEIFLFDWMDFSNFYNQRQLYSRFALSIDSLAVIFIEAFSSTIWQLSSYLLNFKRFKNELPNFQTNQKSIIK